MACHMGFFIDLRDLFYQVALVAVNLKPSIMMSRRGRGRTALSPVLSYGPPKLTANALSVPGFCFFTSSSLCRSHTQAWGRIEIQMLFPSFFLLPFLFCPKTFLYAKTSLLQTHSNCGSKTESSALGCYIYLCTGPYVKLSSRVCQ